MSPTKVEVTTIMIAKNCAYRNEYKKTGGPKGTAATPVVRKGPAELGLTAVRTCGAGRRLTAGMHDSTNRRVFGFQEFTQGHRSLGAWL